MRNFAPSIRTDAVEQREASLREGRKNFNEKELPVWYEWSNVYTTNLFYFADPIKAGEVKLEKFCAKGLKTLIDRYCSN